MMKMNLINNDEITYLCYRMLDRALRDLNDVEHRQEAKNWLFDSNDDVLSCETCCYVLNINYDFFIKKIKSKLK